MRFLILSASLSVSEHYNIADIVTLVFVYTELNVTVSAVYRPAPGEAPGELAPNEFTAGSELTLNCLVHGNSSELSYRWSVSGYPSTPLMAVILISHLPHQH